MNWTGRQQLTDALHWLHEKAASSQRGKTEDTGMTKDEIQTELDALKSDSEKKDKYIAELEASLVADGKEIPASETKPKYRRGMLPGSKYIKIDCATGESFPIEYAEWITISDR